jgi:hypothetical protein
MIARGWVKGFVPIEMAGLHLLLNMPGAHLEKIPSYNPDLTGGFIYRRRGVQKIVQNLNY